MDDSDGSGAIALRGCSEAIDREDSYDGKAGEVFENEGDDEAVVAIVVGAADRDTEGDEAGAIDGTGVLSANCFKLDIILLVMSSGLGAPSGICT